MERYQELFYMHVLSGELSKNISLYYHIGYLFGYTGEELMLVLLYSHFSYHISLYSILMAKYLATSSFPLFSIQLHQHMLTMGLDTYYFQVLTNLNLTQVFWPEHALHVLLHQPVIEITRRDELYNRYTLGFIGTFNRRYTELMH